MKWMAIVELWLLLCGQPFTETPPPPPDECSAEDCTASDSSENSRFLRRLFPSINNGY
jgi:hypothetical protein